MVYKINLKILLLFMFFMSCSKKNSEIVIETLEEMYQNKKTLNEFCDEKLYYFHIAGYQEEKEIFKKIRLIKINDDEWQGEYTNNDKIQKVIFKNGKFYNLKNKEIKELKEFKFYFQEDKIKREELKVLSEVDINLSGFPSLYAKYNDKDSIVNYLKKFTINSYKDGYIIIFGENRGEKMNRISIEIGNKTSILETCGIDGL